MPPALWHLNFNPLSGFYEILEEGVTYKMQLEETRALKDYFRNFRSIGGTNYPSIAGWYNDLAKDTKKMVLRDGKVKAAEHNGFYPDSWIDF
jgi:hypothetical protein